MGGRRLAAFLVEGVEELVEWLELWAAEPVETRRSAFRRQICPANSTGSGWKCQLSPSPQEAV